MGNAPQTYRGVILSSREYKEKDRVIRFLTKDDGLLDIYVKGTGKLNSSNAFTSVPFMLCDITAAPSHGYLYFRTGAIIESNSRIMNDLDTITSASHFSDLLSDISGQSENSSEAYELAVYSFYNLSKNPDKWELYTAAFNWRVLSMLGFTVVYSVTNDTGSVIEDNNYYYLSISGGEICSGKKSGYEYFRLSGVAVKALNYIATCDIQNLYGIKGSEGLAESLKDFTLRYLSYQFDKDYKSRFSF